jgi:hypothetical protein
MMTGETGFEGPVILRLTDAGRSLIGSLDVGMGVRRVVLEYSAVLLVAVNCGPTVVARGRA